MALQQVPESGRDRLNQGQPTGIVAVRFIPESQHQVPDLRRLHGVGAAEAQRLDRVERRSHQSREVQRIECHAEIPQRAIQAQRDGREARAHPKTLRRHNEWLESVGLSDLELQRHLVEVER